jgi:hypothetical protein
MAERARLAQVEVHPLAEQGDGFRLEADMLLFVGPLSGPHSRELSVGWRRVVVT